MNPKNFSFIDLFSGIGGIRLGFEAVGGECVFSSEWDKHAQATYEANYGEKPLGDITEIQANEIPDHDILTAGFPCQPFSIIGNGLGFADTRGTLFFEIARILKAKRPHAFLLENARRLTSHDKGRTFRVIKDRLEKLNYYVHWRILNTLDFGLPQKRERVYIVGFLRNYLFDFPSKPVDDINLSLSDILDDDDAVDPKWFASEYIRKKRLVKVNGKNIFYPSIWHENKSGNISILPFSTALRADASFSYILVNGKRRLTPREQLRLQGFPDTFQISGTETQIRKQTGNSVAIPVVKAIAREMLSAIKAGKILPEKESIEDSDYSQLTLI